MQNETPGQGRGKGHLFKKVEKVLQQSGGPVYKGLSALEGYLPGAAAPDYLALTFRSL